MGRLRDAEVKAAGDAVKARAKAEREALTVLEKAKQAQLDTESRYKDALERLRSAGTGEASFGNAMGLRVAARQALEAGDLERAKKNAQSALQMLLELADAGENTYGFEGFIKSLRDIEDQADKVSLDKAKNSFEQAQQQAAELKTLLDELKDATITVTMDQEALDKVYLQLAQLAQATGRPLELPDRPVSATSSGNAQLPAGSSTPPATSPAPTQSGQADRNSFTDVPTVEAEVRVTGIRQDGPNSWTNLPPVEVSVLPKGIHQDGGNSFTDLPPASVDLQIDPGAESRALQDATALAQRLSSALGIPITPVIGGGAAPQASPVDGYATGGLVSGPGTGTSDSIPAMLSNGEYVMRAAAVSRLGKGFLDLLNQGMPVSRFADGGLVDAAATAQAAEPAFKSFGRLDIALGDQVLQTYVQPGPSLGTELKKLRMKFGSTRIR
ncbi:hypothetical protein VLF92_22275 [Pseudomonas chengduensis]